MFDVPQMVKSLTIVMKAPMPWGYFGLNDVNLLSSGDESFMLVSGRSSSEGEHCLIASGFELGAAACLDAVAAGDGREVFAFRGEQLVQANLGTGTYFRLRQVQYDTPRASIHCATG